MLLAAPNCSRIEQRAHGMAHQLNELLTVISGYSELLMLRNPNTQGLERTALEEIQHAAARSAALTPELMELHG